MPRKDLRAYKVWPPTQGEFPQGAAVKQGRNTQLRVDKHKCKEHEHHIHRQEHTSQCAINHNSDKKHVARQSTKEQKK